MGEGIMHIMTPLSAPWCGWTMLALFLFAVLAEWLQPGVISQAHQSLFARTDRTYKEAPMNFFGQICIALARIGVLAMALCACLCTDGHCSFTGFCAVCGWVVAVLLVKMLCNLLLDYTFALSRKASAPYEHYGNVATIAALILYPALLVVLKIGTPVAAQWVLGAATMLFLGMWIYRSGRMFVSSPAAILYMVLYIGTLEVLPLAALYYLSEKTITIL